jgi:cell surface protein SprA
LKKKLFSITSTITVLALTVWAMASNAPMATHQYGPPMDAGALLQDTGKVDLKYPIKDFSGIPALQNEEGGMIDPGLPSNIQYSTQYDPATNQVTVYRKIGGMDVRLPYTMSLEEYMDADTRNSIINYWDQRMQIESGRSSEASILNPKFNLGGEGFNSIFGSNLIDIKMQGMAELKIGMSKNRIDNPTLQERLRKPPPTLDFEENIQMNITGNIGDKMKLGVNYNTQALFDFENEIKLEYTGKEDEIIRKIEAGNVSMPLPGTLITGSQSLFGLKTDMQFGKLGVSAIFSQQKGQSQVINIEGGALKQEYEVAIVDYDRNRHFFLAHEFREEFEKSLSSLPIVTTQYTITKVEVWVTNKTNNYNDSRNIVGFMDLGEDSTNISNPFWQDQAAGDLPTNDANNLYAEMTAKYPDARDINKVSATLSDLTGGVDYEKIENARLLSANEYTFNPQLGFVSLNNSLLNDEVVAVAFEYTYQGQVYKVGEFSNDGIIAPNALWLKLLKGSNLSPRFKTWELMMKNIYSIGAYQVNRDDFKLDVVYVNDSTGTDLNFFPEGSKPDMGGINGELLLRVMNLDAMNTNLEPYPDGVFDYVEGFTIMPQNGRIMFPVLKPFGAHLEKKLNNQSSLIKKYVFNELYDTTQTVAAQTAEKNKFLLKGSYKSSSSSEISLNAMNIPQGSVVVTAGGIRLTENIDYTVDYTLGRIKIINPGLMQSGTPIQVSLESQSLYALQTKTLMGVHLDYEFNDKFTLGGTLMHLRERPLTQKVNIGDEPIANTIWGMNGAYATESQVITNWLDKLPGYVGTQPSRISFEGEFAQLLPGHPDVIGDAGDAYIDDFEGSKISYDLKNWTSWKLASTPQGQTDKFPFASEIDDLRYGYERAKTAWYTIDPIFYRQFNETPSHILNDKDQLSNHFVREIFEKELFPDKEAAYGQPTNIPVLNLAYYPNERGPYNFDSNVDFNGFLKNPEQRWGGIMRKIETIDFEAANIEYIEFWLMDPFVYDPQAKGGDLYLNLGDVSEDILRDSRKSFEQGLPGPGEPDLVDTTAWGRVPRTQSMVNAFSSNAQARRAQDVGLDGLSSAAEKTFFTSFIEQINQKLAVNEISQDAYRRMFDDPSADDYHYYRGSDYDAAQTNVLDRYKNFNGAEGNSVATEYSPESYSTAATTVPDVEDINLDNTLSENESYYQYRVELKPEKMVVGENFISTMVEREVELKNGNKEKIKWYQFKIPISEHEKPVVGSIGDFRSIRFLRMYMHNFTDTAILRFATMDLVRGDWRKYSNDLFEASDDATPNSETEFVASVVNIEENSDRDPVNYVLPLGIDRVIDPSNPQVRQLNEQSLSLRVKDLGAKDSRAVYKTVNMDFRQYKKLKMEIHAEAIPGYALENDEVTAFIRLGSDYKNNYYEYEIPLKLTAPGKYGDNTADRLAVWPEENRLEVVLDKFTQLKLRRNDAKRRQGSNASLTDVYKENDSDKPNNEIKIKGNPNLSNVKTVMLGVRVRGNGTKSVEVWMNELRLSDFDEDGGWAANARMKIDLSDLGSVSVAGKRSTAGFGSIDQSVMERSQEDFSQFDIATNIEAGKMLGPQSRVSVPVYFGVSKAVTNPKYYALDPDIPMEVALKNAETSAAKDSIKLLSQTIVERKSLNFTNVRLMPSDKAKPSFLSPSNLSATYAYNETKLSDVNTDHSIDKTYQGMLAYTYLARPKPIEPFKTSKMFASKAATLIRDFNFYIVPNQVSYRWEFMRDYNEVQLRNLSNPDFNIEPSVSRSFDWNRFFDLNYNLTKSLRLDYKAATNARIDEPSSILVVNKHLYPDEYRDWRDSVLYNIFSMGRTTNFTHNFNASYTVPINKIPLLDWTTANLRYGAMYSWRMGAMQMPELGNTILNTNSIQAGGQMNFTTLYNKSGYLKELNRKYSATRRPTTNQNQNNKRTERFNKDGLDFEKDKPVVIKHNLRTEEVSVRVYDKDGRPVQGDSKALGPNRVEFMPRADAPGGRVMVTGTVEDVTTPFTVSRDYLFLLLTGVKNASVQYNQTNGTILPGYMEDATFMGMSNGNPGLGFVFGAQNKNIGTEAINKGWLTTDEAFNSAFAMTTTDDFQAKVSIVPIQGLKIDLNGDRRFQEAMSSYFLPAQNLYSNPMYNGSFNISTILWNTSFNKVGKSGGYSSDVYDEFLQNRSLVSARLGTVGYGTSSQDVLIPSFIAAYSGKDASSVSLDLFPDISSIRPNWRVSYDGLSKIKALQKYIKSFDIVHAYRAYQSITSYVSNLEHNGIKTDLNDDIIPLYQVNTLTLSEQFNPLIQFNLTWVNSLNTRIEYKKSRMLSLSLANSQVIENYTNDLVIGAGYRINKLNLNIGNRAFSSDVNLRADVTFGETLAIIRKVEEGVNQLTAGQKKVSVKFTADYALSDKFNVQLYYDTNVNNPYIANSYPMATTNFGLSFRFVLAQ